MGIAKASYEMAFLSFIDTSLFVNAKNSSHKLQEANFKQLGISRKYASFYCEN